jgi:hypothetical protein
MPTADSTAAAAPAEDFSLVLGGPLYQLFRRAHLSGDVLQQSRRRVVVIALVAWLPLLVLSAAQGTALQTVAVPFLRDVELHVRFLVALPLLVIAEIVVHQRLGPTLRLFSEREVIPPSQRERFAGVVAAAYRLRNSVVAEVGLVLFVYLVGVQLLWRQWLSLNTATWYGAPGVDGPVLSFAGYWYGYVSLPIFQFLLCRWYLRIFIWARFLFHVSRVELSLVPSHPDKLGGLGFLGGSAYAFVPLALAHGALLAGTLANRVFYAGADIRAFKPELALMVLWVLLLACAPLLVFAPQLSRTRRRGIAEYGTLAERYVRDFEAKWLRGGAPPGEPLLGSADIQSLADLSNSVEGVRTMRSVPVSRDAVIRLALATAAPITPLLLTIMPLEELAKKLFGLLF